jgi:phosphonate dehydrogenase
MPQTPLIVATNRIFPETRALLSEHGTVIANQAIGPWSHDEVRAHCREADAMMAFMTDEIDVRLIEACPRLKVIGAALKGYDNIDVEAADRAGIWVTIVPDLLTVPTAELAIGLMLALGRHILRGDRTIRQTGFHGWRPSLYGRGIDGTTVGIVGFGRVGQAIAERLAGFRCRVLACDAQPVAVDSQVSSRVEVVGFEALIATSDYVVLALPLTRATKHIIGKAAIGAMKPGALLVNPARGSLVDEAAVGDALASGRLAGYAADVFPCEDWARPDRPHGIDPRLTALDAPTVLTPHIGSAVTHARREIELSAARSIIEALSGVEPSGAVNTPKQPRTCSA